MVAFAQDVVDFFQPANVPSGESLLVRDKEVPMSRAQPAREDALQKNIGVESGFGGEDRPDRRDAPAVGDGHMVPGPGEAAVDQVDIAIQADAIGACNDIDVGHDRVIGLTQE